MPENIFFTSQKNILEKESKFPVKYPKKNLVLRPGFEPESSARKAGMIGRTTLPEHFACT